MTRASASPAQVDPQQDQGDPSELHPEHGLDPAQQIQSDAREHLPGDQQTAGQRRTEPRCELSAGGYDGWAPKSAVWGVKADEILE